MTDLPLTVSADYGAALRKLYPDAQPGQDYLVQSDGATTQLTFWNLPGDPPSDEQVQAAVAQIAWDAVQAQAQDALDASDTVALRCFKAGVPFPAEWLAYVNALRAIVRAASGDPAQPLPVRPSYPAGT